jgi:CBS domain containing-hemolysin-like protein
MADLLLSVGRLLFALFLVGLNGFFVASEFALVRIRSTSVDRLVSDGRAGSRTLRNVVDNLDDYLATTQLGITIASLGLGWVGEPAIAALIEPVLGEFLPQSTMHLVAIAIGFSVITFLHVVFGELAPKTIAIQRAERIALFVAMPMRISYLLLYPGIVVFNGAANAFTKLLGVDSASETTETFHEEEIRAILARSGQEGQIGHSEAEMAAQVFKLDDRTARSVMVPRPDVVSVEPDQQVSTLRDLVRSTGHTRYPVVDDEDNIQGFIDVKDVLTAEDESATAGDLARDLTIVPETITVDDLLARLQSEHNQMAAVIDEWGVMQGIATIEDVTEAVVGEIYDNFDSPDSDPSVVSLADGGYAADGSVQIETVNELVDTGFSHDETESIGGLVLDALGRAPEIGDRIQRNDYVFEVTDTDGARISRVTIRAKESIDDETTEENN